MYRRNHCVELIAPGKQIARGTLPTASEHRMAVDGQPRSPELSSMLAEVETHAKAAQSGMKGQGA
ncbi:MAG TPA: hypothetical protein VIV60_18355, partial [Polyangiaceae bacterium]